MSTRCQVKVTGIDINGSASFTLYHHCDGYPSNMVPLIQKAYQDTWQAHRIGKAAAMVVSADPLGYELEEGHDIYPNVEFYYVIDITADESRSWVLSVYEVPYGSKHTFDMNLLGNGEINSLNGEEIEKALPQE